MKFNNEFKVTSLTETFLGYFGGARPSSFRPCSSLVRAASSLDSAALTVPTQRSGVTPISDHSLTWRWSSLSPSSSSSEHLLSSSETSLRSSSPSSSARLSAPLCFALTSALTSACLSSTERIRDAKSRSLSFTSVSALAFLDHLLEILPGLLHLDLNRQMNGHLHKRHTGSRSSRQNISSSRSCSRHSRACRSAAGAISRWAIRVATRRWGSRWASQYDVRHTRQDFRAPTRGEAAAAAHTSHAASPGSADRAGGADAIRLKASASSLKAALTLISGRWVNGLSQAGQRQASAAPAPAHAVSRQARQKLCPQGVVTGSVNTWRHTVHWNCSSGSAKHPGEAMA
ncbi:hypothetical protein EYF80_036383 [Liparis tanakae]|uniref:Uncharacterized protein n=1 Tax=Liparis tanakae TaxID=230148 RepID=A0A4Z2GIW8_9TELE|nr:hypothetical protein EYF80_036383 [Liparis tanakae]